MNNSKSLDERRISKEYGLSTDDAKDYVLDIRSKMANEYKNHTAEWVAGKYNVSIGSVKYAAKQFGVKKDITQTQFKRIEDYNISKLEQTAEESKVIPLIASIRDYAKAGWSMTKTAVGVAAATLVFAGAIYLGNHPNKSSYTAPKQNSAITQTAPSYSLVPSAGAEEAPRVVPKSADSEKAYVLPAGIDKIQKNPKPVRTVVAEETKSVKTETKIVQEVIEKSFDVSANSIEANAESAPIIIPANVTPVASVKNDTDFMNPTAGYFYGNNGGVASVGASFNYSERSITPSLITDGSDVGASLSISEKLSETYSLQGSVATLGGRSAVALGIEKMFNSNNDKKTKYGLGLGLYDKFGSNDDGFGAYGSGMLMRKLGNDWNVGANVMIDSQGNYGVGGFVGYGNGNTYDSGIASWLVANSEDASDETSNGTGEQTQTQETDGGDNGSHNPIIPPVNPVTPDQTTWGTGRPVGH